MLPLSKIRPGDNPRRYFDQLKHGELATSIRLRGLLQPLLLRPSGDDDAQFVIVAGERRYKAALEVFGPEGEVPVVIREMTDQEALEAAIDENDIREDASETEQADAALRVLAACQSDRAEAARRLGWSASKLDRRLALADLSETVKTALNERRVKVGHAELLAVVPADKQDKALETILSAGLDVAKTRELLMRVTQSLAAAVFDKTECTTCPFNSGSQRALFETHVDDGHCTNPGCFQLKTEAMEKSSPPAGADEPAPAKATTPAPSAAAAPSKPEAKPARGAPAASKPSVTTASVAKHVTDLREAAWRGALIQAAEGDPEIARAFEAVLRDTWQVDRTFLSRFGKDELKFIAHECGLVKHMGEKAFAKLLAAPNDKIVAGMLNATGFSWAGRLPSAMTIDGKYGPPAEAASSPATSDKD
ncbi:MAG TPA: PRTRC system ParB family protein [Sphingomonas sp.]|nr:PRTRC system ParB family protein [Sphingomonas sp.]